MRIGCLTNPETIRMRMPNSDTYSAS